MVISILGDIWMYFKFYVGPVIMFLVRSLIFLQHRKNYYDRYKKVCKRFKDKIKNMILQNITSQMKLKHRFISILMLVS